MESQIEAASALENTQKAEAYLMKSAAEKEKDGQGLFKSIDQKIILKNPQVWLLWQLRQAQLVGERRL